MDEFAKPNTVADQNIRNLTLLGIAGLCVALNVGLGSTANLIKLPIYLDAIGTIACALLAGQLGWRGFLLSALVGTISFTISGLLLTPAVLWFIPTQVAIAAYAFYVARPVLKNKLGSSSLHLSTIWQVIMLGIGLGIVAGVISAPIIAYVFGGITGSGPSVIVALLLKAGTNLMNSVLASGLASEPIDKTVQLAAAVILVRATPARIRRLFL
jgi:energy-coupling factor transport system substrate-specific component